MVRRAEQSAAIAGLISGKTRSALSLPEKTSNQLNQEVIHGFRQ
jgi:hypothetical protein